MRTHTRSTTIPTLGLILAVTLIGPATPAFSQWTSSRPDGHAPIGVMGDHTHEGGEFMFSYRFMAMGMDGSRVDDERVSDRDIVDPDGLNFVITPTRMPMMMHMFSLMFAPSNDLTLMGMLPITTSEMDHLTRAGGTFTTKSSGLGDIRLTALYLVRAWGNERLHLHAGVSLPTGSITAKDVTPASAPAEALLPYPMQLGSGTFDVLPGATYLGEAGDWSWGAQASGVIRIGTNSDEYALGNVGRATAWGARRVIDWLSASARLDGARWGNIDGANPSYANAVSSRTVPTVFPDLRGGSRVGIGLGANVWIPSGQLKGLRVAVEGFIPLYQRLDGPQLETDFVVIAGLQYAFG